MNCRVIKSPAALYNVSLMKTSDYDYDLPQACIAQRPAEPRDSSRLMVFDRLGAEPQHRIFRDIGAFLAPGDLLVVNRTRVIPARLDAVKVPTGGKIEILLLNRREPQVWETLVGGKGLKPGRRVGIPCGDADLLAGEIIEDLGGPRRLIRFDRPLGPELDALGQMPLPPYIHEKLADPERYQTVYAQDAGSAAAPTAGLHFTPGLMAELEKKGVGFATVTLHVGLDTFAPVHEDDPAEHRIHTEWCSLPPETAEAINRTRAGGGRVICVGTTSVRTVETAARAARGGESVRPFEGPTDLYILPGYSFRAVDAIITNFHLPKSTLLMMISAFAGRERVLDMYELAKREGYRFYSFGDAMFIQ